MPLIYTLVIPAEPDQVEPSGAEWCRVGPLLLTSRASFVDANLGGSAEERLVAAVVSALLRVRLVTSLLTSLHTTTIIYTLVIPAEPDQVEPSGAEWCRVGPLLLTSRASFVDANLGGSAKSALLLL